MSSNSSLLGQLEHIVLLMLENRSFDHMLGFLYADQGNVSPLGQPFAGLTGNESNPNGTGGAVQVFKISPTGSNPYFMPGADPGEGYLNTNSQLFGSTQEPNPITSPSNNGFVTNFAYTLGWESKESGAVIAGTTASDIMGMYTPELLPVLSGLAKGYAVCDYWYASAPTETLPNRAFVCCATSQGFLADSANKVYTAPSIFTALGNAGATWAVYGYDAPPLARGLIADITQAPESHFGEFPDFQQAVHNGTLANYAFLEPQWGSQGNSQHPNYDVSKGEQFLHDVYYAMYGSSLWASTLLIITYDEHGGCYDHVPPPENAVAPDNSAGQYGFNFQRFGLRVPTLLVSPLIQAGTVFRAAGQTPFDHTSVLATLEKRFGASPLTKRDAAAPEVSSVLTLAKPRTDDPLQGVTPPQSQAAPRLPLGPSHLQEALANTAELLPVADREGAGYHHAKPELDTGRSAIEYARKRFDDYAKSRK